MGTEAWDQSLREVEVVELDLTAEDPYADACRRAFTEIEQALFGDDADMAARTS